MNQNFVEYVKSHIKEYLPMEYQNAVVSINEVTKSNDRLLTGLTILLPENGLHQQSIWKHSPSRWNKGCP